MIWGLFIGPDDPSKTWEGVARTHGDWLQMSLRSQRRELPDGRAVSLIALAATGQPDTPWQPSVPRSIEAGGNQVWVVTDAVSEPDGIHLSIDLNRGVLDAHVPVAACEPLYETIDNRGLLLTNDLRLAGLWTDRTPDEKGIYAQYQYGAVPAPGTLFRSVRRIPNGHTLFRDLHTAATRLDRVFSLDQDGAASLDPQPPPSSMVDLEKAYWDALRRRLAAVPKGAILFFSGGVDSALLAGFYRDLARPDIRLLNLAFGEQDPEAAFARKTAKMLGFELESVVCRAAVDPPEFLQRMARDYSFPFSDDSVIPTNVLVHKALPLCLEARHVVEGLGPDQLFGVRGSDPLLRRALRMPRLLRWIGGEAYHRLGLAERESRVGHMLSRFRKSLLGDPCYGFSITANCLDGIAYQVPGDVRAEIEENLATYYDALAPDPSYATRFAVLHLVHGAAGIIGMKFFDPLRRFGVHRHVPFMQKDLVQLGLQIRCREDFDGSVAKAFIKRKLTEYIPSEMVYRRKRGFSAPLWDYMRDDYMQAMVREVVLSPANPLRGSFKADFVRRIADKTRKHMVSFHAYHYLWGLIFLSGWWQQLPQLAKDR